MKTLARLDRYGWCGHSVLMGKTENEWQDCDYVLKWFGEKQAYRTYVQKGIHDGRRPELVGGGLIRSVGAQGYAALNGSSGG